MGDLDVRPMASRSEGAKFVMNVYAYTAVERQLSGKQVRACFWVLATVVILNLNGLARMGFGVNQAFSVLILLTSVIGIGLSRYSVEEALGFPGVVLATFIIFYVVTAAAVGYAEWNDLRISMSGYFQSLVNSLLIICAAAVGAYNVLSMRGARVLYLSLERIVLISLVAVVLSPLLRNIYVLRSDSAAFRFAGTFGNPNDAGTLACIGMALSLALLNARIRDGVSWLTLTVSVLAAILSFSRTAILTAVVLILMQFLMPSVPGHRRRVASWVAIAAGGVALSAVIGGLVTVLSAPGQLQRLTDVLAVVRGGNLGNAGLGDRLIVWRLARHLIEQSPLLGNGLGTLHEIANAPFNAQNLRLGAHNQYLTVWGEGGVVSLILFLSAIGLIAARSFRAQVRLTGRFVVSFVLVFCIACVTSHNELTTRFEDLMLGVSCAALSYDAGQPETG